MNGAATAAAKNLMKTGSIALFINTAAPWYSRVKITVNTGKNDIFYSLPLDYMQKKSKSKLFLHILHKIRYSGKELTGL